MRIAALCFFASVLACGSSQAAVLFNNTGLNIGYTFRTAGSSMPAGRWTNTNAFDIRLTRVAFFGKVLEPTNVKYALTNSSGTVLASVVAPQTPDAGYAENWADVNWIIGAGSEFYIASLIESGDAEFGRTSGPLLENGLQSMQNGNFVGYSSPVKEANGLAHMTWVLEGEPVPEPGMMAALGLGLAAMLRRRRG